MPGGRSPDDSEGTPPPLSLWQRVLLALPRLKHDGARTPLGERFRNAVVKPAEPSAATKAKAADRPPSVGELEESVRSADDKERLVGLLLAPVAAAIGLVVVSNQIANHPAQHLTSGRIDRGYVSVSLLHELELVLLALALLMLVTAMLRKRLFLGIVMALYGLAIFNLHWWGFGIPYIMAGAWLLVRAYRLQRDLKEATGDGPSRSGSRGRQGRGRGATDSGGPRPNKRYTPPTPPPKRSPPPKAKSKPENEKRAG
jgi:hypothetical protein